MQAAGDDTSVCVHGGVLLLTTNIHHDYTHSPRYLLLLYSVAILFDEGPKKGDRTVLLVT
jgi:hypothetical protein